MSTLAADIRGAFRSVRKNPGFSAVVVLTLALGIGANVALLSVVRAVVLSPLPYGNEARLVNLWSQWVGFPKTWVSVGEYRHYRDTFESFDGVALYITGSANLTDADQPERVGVAGVTPNAFDVLGIGLPLGRSFTVDEARPETSGVVVLSNAVWRRRYGGDVALVGRRVELDGIPRTVIGVLPEGFRLPIDFSRDAETGVYLPLDTPEGVSPLEPLGGSHSYYVVARLRDGVTLEQAEAEALAFNQRATAEGAFPEERRFRTLVIPVRDDILGTARVALFLLLGAVGFVMLIACSNVANLVLSRGQARQRELALRTALGAGTGVIFRQLLTESVVLASMGGAVALVLARWSLWLLVKLEPGSVPRLAEARIDGGALLFGLVLTMATSLLFGLLPAWSWSRVSLRGALAEGPRGSSSGPTGGRFRVVLVGLQVAMAVVLVTGAGLMIRTFAHLIRIDPGFRAENVLTMKLSAAERDYPEPGDVIAFYETLLARVRALPSVEAAGAVRVLPLASQIGDWGMAIEGYEPSANENPSADWQLATEGYFEALRIPLVEGRLFDSSDRIDSEPVIIVNEAFAKRYWPGESAVGKRVLTRGAADPPWARVIGVVGNVRHNGITADIKEKWYRPHSQFHKNSGFVWRDMTLTIRTSASTSTLTGPVRAIVRELDPKLPLAEVRSLEDVLSGSVAESRFIMSLLILFSALALALASVGVYGVSSYLVGQRTAEFGIRMALGSTRARILGMVLRQATSMTLAGLVAGLVVASFMTRLMSSLLYGVAPRDPVTLGIVPLLLLGAALAGCAFPAMRAARVDPVRALRSE